MQITRPGIIDHIQDPAGILPEQYLPGVFRYISYWVNHPVTAEDLTLKVLSKTLAGFKRHNADGKSLAIWLFTIARDEVRLYSRKYAGNGAGAIEKPPGSGDSFFNDLAGRQAWDQLQASLADLSAEEKEIISLKLGAELSNHCIARILGMSDSGVGMGLCQALKKMNRSLSEFPTKG